MNESTRLRQIKSIKITDILPASLSEYDDKPVFEWVDPSSLYIEEKYQRNLTERSTTLIRNIYKDFQWNRLKPPVVSYGQDGKLFVIDGQHTAIAAASHPKIKKIPVMIVSAVTIKDRAGAFMGHNRDRLNVTPAQMFFSSVAAGDQAALNVKEALDETGCVVVRYNPPVWVEGQTMAAGTLMRLSERVGKEVLIRILTILMDAKRAPIVSLEISAVADLLRGKEWKNKFEDKNLSVVIKSKSAEQWRATAESTVRKGQTMPMKRALAITWYKHVPKNRGKGKTKS